MKAAIENGGVVELDEIDKFVDGAAVKKAGALTYEICRQVLDDIVVVPEGAVCTTIIQMYNKSAIVVEPAGALATAALGFYADKIRGKKVACIVSGSNNDITFILAIFIIYYNNHFTLGKILYCFFYCI